MILLIDKPIGMTSFDVIRRLRQKFGVKKMGHAGTLDPLASGLLIVATEDDTKRLNEFLGLPKSYEVTIRVGERRATGDMEGKIEIKKDVPELSEKEVYRAVHSLGGVHELPVPRYSAVKVNGRPLYRYARKGKKVDVPTKTMTVYDAQFRDMRYEQAENGRRILCVRCALHVSSGTYIRSLSEELGRRLGYPATTETLRRARIGEFDVSSAEKLYC